MENKYELTDDEIDEIYDYLFTSREQFVHKADPDNNTKLYYVEEEFDTDDSYIYALILLRNNYITYDAAYDKLSDYKIYDDESMRNDDFERLVHEQAEFSIEDALIEGNKSWLIQYIDVDEVAEDMERDRSYAEVLSCYEEEIEDTINGVTYYLYKN